ncbi:MAG: phospholipase D-like domain-containing protein [Pirellulales bacterium]
MTDHLPTFTSAEWTVTALLDSIKGELDSDDSGVVLRLFAYAISDPGWRELRTSVLQWLGADDSRSVIAYVGTDHALTDPDALRTMEDDSIEIRIMRKYHGIFHPKVLWLSGEDAHVVWIGSNNITREGLLHNIEFASVIRCQEENTDLAQWFGRIHDASEACTPSLLTSYESERRAFATARSTVGTFTWSRREEPPLPPTGDGRTSRRTRRTRTRTRRRTHLVEESGDLVVEIMPRETGLDGKQIQLPKNAVVKFFGLRNRLGASRQITLTPVGTTRLRTLTMTLFGNNTARLSITELDYRDRPCVMLFHPDGRGAFSFEIIQQSIFPGRYRRLLALCGNQTRTGSRRWCVVL